MSSKVRAQVMMASALVVGTVWVCLAQAPTAAPAPGGTGAPTVKAVVQPQGKTLLDYWKVGGPVMYPIGLCSVAALALGIYGFMYTRQDKMLRPDLVPQLQQSIENLNIEEALNICGGSPCMLTNVLSAGLRRISDGILDIGSIEKAMEESSIEETNEGLKPLNNLSVASQIAPMLGLLGTVTGMIGAFNSIALGNMGDPEKLAGDIGEAMITTAAGLIVAIPAMMAYFYLKGVFAANVARLSRVLGGLLHALVAASRRVQGGGTDAAGEAMTAHEEPKATA